MSVWDLAEKAARLRLRAGGLARRAIEGPAGSIHVYDAEGSGPRPPVLLLHGIGSSATAYGKLMLGLLPRAARVLAPDLPGHGFSHPIAPPVDPEALAEQCVSIVDTLLDPLDPVVLVGTSMGGALALRYALARPARVAALVLCSPAGAPIEGDDLDALRAQFRVEALPDARAFVDRLFAGRPPARWLVSRAVRDRLRRPVVQTLLAGVGPESFLTPAEAARLDPPTLLLWGGRERVLPEGCLEWFARHLPDSARIERPAGWGHSAHLEHTAELVDRICAFVDRVGPAEGDPSAGESCPQAAGEAPSG